MIDLFRQNDDEYSTHDEGNIFIYYMYPSVNMIQSVLFVLLKFLPVK